MTFLTKQLLNRTKQITAVFLCQSAHISVTVITSWSPAPRFTFTTPAVLEHVISGWTDAGERTWSIHAPVLTQKLREAALIQIYGELKKKMVRAELAGRQQVPAQPGRLGSVHQLISHHVRTRPTLGNGKFKVLLFEYQIKMKKQPISPMQEVPSDANSNPSSQLHMKEP